MVVGKATLRIYPLKSGVYYLLYNKLTLERKINMDINWFPGHMAKTRRELKENLKR